MCGCLSTLFMFPIYLIYYVAIASYYMVSFLWTAIVPVIRVVYNFFKKSVAKENSKKLKYKSNKIFNTDNKISFDTLKSTNDLQNYISNTYNLNITSSLKSGNINNLDIIIFTISDDTGVGYCIFTKLNDSEVAYAKIYNTENSSKLISDLSNPITKISAVIASMQN